MNNINVIHKFHFSYPNGLKYDYFIIDTFLSKKGEIEKIKFYITIDERTTTWELEKEHSENFIKMLEIFILKLKGENK